MRWKMPASPPSCLASRYWAVRGELPAFGVLQVCVADLHLSRAQAVLAEIGLCGEVTRAV